jgi:hypothetical protein
MRRNHMIAIAALGATFLVLLATQVIPAFSPSGARATPAMDIMQMMRDAKGLPEQSFDAI